MPPHYQQQNFLEHSQIGLRPLYHEPEAGDYSSKELYDHAIRQWRHAKSFYASIGADMPDVQVAYFKSSGLAQSEPIEQSFQDDGLEHIIGILSAYQPKPNTAYAPSSPYKALTSPTY